MILGAVRSIGLGEMSVAQGCDDILTARGLGSCVGIAVYDRLARIAIMAHVMLPGPAPARLDPEQPARYAAQALESIVRALEEHGGTRRGLVVKIAGGAQVIRLNSKDDRLQVGLRNIEAVHAALASHGLTIAAEDTGGTVGRTFSLYAATGQTTVRRAGGLEQPL